MSGGGRQFMRWRNDAGQIVPFWRGMMVLAVLAAAVIASWQSAQAYTFKPLYSFCSKTNCVDGTGPQGGLIMDGAGNLYGTTVYGGTHCSSSNPQGCGTVFELVLNHATGQFEEKVLYSFCAKTNCADGLNPQAGLIMDGSGNLYGTTANPNADCSTLGPPHCGNAFELVFDAATGRYKEKVLYTFCVEANCVDGLNPQESLIRDASGNLYGTTVAGGANCSAYAFPPGCGTVFELTPVAGTERFKHKILYNFCDKASCRDGSTPFSDLAMDGLGNLYGLTYSGGDPKYNVEIGGTAFELVFDTATGRFKEKVLYDFCSNTNCNDGQAPMGGLIMDASGNLYGTTGYGGRRGGHSGSKGSGTTFELVFDAATGRYKHQVLHKFCSIAPHCSDGENPQAGLIMDEVGNLYGTTTIGGIAKYPGGGDYGAGTVYQLVPNVATGTFSYNQLHSFCAEKNCADGLNPGAALIMDASGNLFGATTGGGSSKNAGYGAGTVFELVND